MQAGWPSYIQAVAGTYMQAAADWQAGRQADWRAVGQPDGQARIHTGWQASRQTCSLHTIRQRHTCMRTHRQADIERRTEADAPAGRRAGMQSYTHPPTHTVIQAGRDIHTGVHTHIHTHTGMYTHMQSGGGAYIQRRTAYRHIHTAGLQTTRQPGRDAHRQTGRQADTGIQRQTGGRRADGEAGMRTETYTRSGIHTYTHTYILRHTA